MQKNAGPIYDE